MRQILWRTADKGAKRAVDDVAWDQNTNELVILKAKLSAWSW